MYLFIGNTKAKECISCNIVQKTTQNKTKKKWISGNHLVWIPIGVIFDQFFLFGFHHTIQSWHVLCQLTWIAKLEWRIYRWFKLKKKKKKKNTHTDKWYQSAKRQAG